jgi:hypothetical protein
MQSDENKDATGGGTMAPAVNAVEAGTSALDEIVKEIEADTPYSVIRQVFGEPLDALVKLAGQARDVNLLARLHSVISILESEDTSPKRKEMLRFQAHEVARMVQERGSEIKSVPKGIISGQQPVMPSLPPKAESCEGVLRALPSIGDKEIGILAEQGLLDPEKLLNTDSLELARITGLATNTAFEIKELVRRIVDERAKQDIERRVSELKTINEQLNAECDRITAANNTLLMNNKSVKSQYPIVSEQYDQEVRNFKELQSRVVSARIESNRLSTEINFLREEHQKLLDLVEEKHLHLDDLFRRFNGIRGSFEFVSGETAFAQDIMANVEGLLKKALSQKKLLNDKIATSEQSIEKLFSEFNEIVRKGKVEFYRSI